MFYSILRAFKTQPSLFSFSHTMSRLIRKPGAPFFSGRWRFKPLKHHPIAGTPNLVPKTNHNTNHKQVLFPYSLKSFLDLLRKSALFSPKSLILYVVSIFTHSSCECGIISLDIGIKS